MADKQDENQLRVEDVVKVVYNKEMACPWAGTCSAYVNEVVPRLERKRKKQKKHEERTTFYQREYYAYPLKVARDENGNPVSIDCIVSRGVQCPYEIELNEKDRMDRLVKGLHPYLNFTPAVQEVTGRVKAPDGRDAIEYSVKGQRFWLITEDGTTWAPGSNMLFPDGREFSYAEQLKILTQKQGK